MFPSRGKNGFTLTELLVVITIIGIISLVSVPSYLGSIKKARYEGGVTEVITLIRDARNTSLIGKIGTASGNTLEGGFGVLIQKNATGSSVLSFQDKNENTIFDAGVDTTLAVYTLPSETILQTMSGARAVDYTVLPFSNDNFNNAVILFRPPQGETFLNENSPAKNLTDLFILLKRYDDQKSKRLKINKISGFIETE